MKVLQRTSQSSQSTHTHSQTFSVEVREVSESQSTTQLKTVKFNKQFYYNNVSSHCCRIKSWKSELVVTGGTAYWVQSETRRQGPQRTDESEHMDNRGFSHRCKFRELKMHKNTELAVAQYHSISVLTIKVLLLLITGCYVGVYVRIDSRGRRGCHTLFIYFFVHINGRFSAM